LMKVRSRLACHSNKRVPAANVLFAALARKHRKQFLASREHTG
jgi:hypothetical protein